MTRGMNLNNPFDLEISNIPWRGKIDPSSDDTFEQFDNMEHGLRAGFRDLLTSYNFRKRTTTTQIISAYAPSSENDTAAYISAICACMSCNADDDVGLNNIGNLVRFGKGVIVQEQGNVLDTIGLPLIITAAQDAMQSIVVNPNN